MYENLSRTGPSGFTFLFLAPITYPFSIWISAAARQLVLEVKQDPRSLLLSFPTVGALLVHPLPPRCGSQLRPELLHCRSSLTVLLLICVRSPNYNLPKCFSIFFLSCSKSIKEWVRRLVSKSHLFHFLSFIFS